MKPNTVTKKISYCYPDSIWSEEFGRPGYFVECTIWNIEGSDQCRTYPDRSAMAGMVYDAADDSELLQVLAEADGAEHASPQYRRWLADQLANPCPTL